jgi:hypothetical protein
MACARVLRVIGQTSGITEKNNDHLAFEVGQVAKLAVTISKGEVAAEIGAGNLGS